ncbi:Pup--protein ligase, partial [Salmonella enterica subsp. enterica serovar Typhimurium]
LRRRTEYRRLTEALVPFLVSRQILVGAGRVVPAGTWPEGEGPAHFAFSQRADFVQDGVSSSTTRSRPIINTRDEPHADAS